jgi:hypothetical protein
LVPLMANITSSASGLVDPDFDLLDIRANACCEAESALQS